MRYPEYPFISHYADIAGFKLHYLDEGPADAGPVVMLHGNPSWSFYYRRLVLALRDRYRCIVPDHIGMGLSARPRSGSYDYTFSQRAADLAGLLDHLGITDNITLVLHDWGGMIGMAYADRFPHRIRRLIILNTAAFHLPATKNIPLPLVLGRIPVLNALLIQGLNAFCRGAVKHCVKQNPMTAEVAGAYLAPYNSWSARIAVRKFVEDIPLKSTDPGYETITRISAGLERFQHLPMLLCWGMKDFVFDEAFLEEWIRRFPDAKVHRFAEAGHYVLEDAAASIIPLARDFLDNHPGH